MDNNELMHYGVGGSIATVMLQGKTMSDNKKLRAYYSHTGNRVYD